MSAIIIKEGEEEAVCGDCVDISIHADYIVCGNIFMHIFMNVWRFKIQQRAIERVLAQKI